jgi:hypothetical protein
MERGSYMLITPGMPVAGPEGTLGIVAEVVADTSLDVFRGIVVSHGLLPMRRTFVSPDALTAVTDTEVQVTLTRAEFDAILSDGPAIPSQRAVKDNLQWPDNK